MGGLSGFQPRISTTELKLIWGVLVRSYHPAAMRPSS